MTAEEIQELLDLEGWPKEILAANLGVVGESVGHWLKRRRVPGKVVSGRMREWLNAARARQDVQDPGPAPEPAQEVPA